MAGTRRGWALVTGASSGLGIELATGLAARGHDLVLAARSEAPMRALATRLEQQHGVTAVVEPIDLSTPDAASVLRDRLDARGITPDILINNAAFGLSGGFVDHDPDQLRAMLQLDIVSLTELTRIFGSRMAARGHGHVLLVGSLASFQPCPRLGAYAAAKAYVRSLGEALHVELAPAVGVTVLSPGLMDTGFNAASGFRPAPSVRPTMLAPAVVARIGLDAMFARRPAVVAGRLNRLMAFSSRLTSRGFQARTALRMSLD